MPVCDKCGGIGQCEIGCSGPTRKFEVGDRVHLTGVVGTVDSFDDYHRQRVRVRWDQGTYETVDAQDLRLLSPEHETILTGKPPAPRMLS